MRIAATSDLHGTLPEIPPCDLLLIAGDVCPMADHNTDYQMSWLLREFSPWLRRQPAREKVWIAGNHDFVCQLPGFRADPEQFGAHYLQDSGVTVDGLRIWGSPWVPRLQDWAFYASDEEARRYFQKIPPETDLLLSHGPVAGILDRVQGQSVGSHILASRLQQISPALCVFGHIHECGGQTLQAGETLFANASLKDEGYRAIYGPLLFDLDLGKNGWKAKTV